MVIYLDGYFVKLACRRGLCARCSRAVCPEYRGLLPSAVSGCRLFVWLEATCAYVYVPRVVYCDVTNSMPRALYLVLCAEAM